MLYWTLLGGIGIIFQPNRKGEEGMADRKKLNEISWQDFKALSLTEKGKYFQSSPGHTLIAQQFSRVQLDDLCALATKIRRIAKRREGANFLRTLLSDKRAMLYFAQPSSRTYLSHNAACQLLGLVTLDVRDSKTSSEVKGETPEDTIRTFSSYVDMIIMRHPVGGFSERVAWMLSNTNRPISVLNAGSGADQHPTQALLDIYTLDRSFNKIGGIDGKSIAFVGDLARGRTVRSLAWLLTLYNDVKIYFVAPDQLQIGADVLELLDAADMEYEVTADFSSVMPKADALYMTRIQDEWDEEGASTTFDTTAFSINAEHLDILKETAIIMHPLPRREEISTDVDSDARAMYWRQMRNGMWARAALILTTFDRQDEVNTYYMENNPGA